METYSSKHECNGYPAIYQKLAGIFCTNPVNEKVERVFSRMHDMLSEDNPDIAKEAASIKAVTLTKGRLVQNSIDTINIMRRLFSENDASEFEECLFEMLASLNYSNTDLVNYGAKLREYEALKKSIDDTKKSIESAERALDEYLGDEVYEKWSTPECGKLRSIKSRQEERLIQLEETLGNAQTSLKDHLESYLQLYNDSINIERRLAGSVIAALFFSQEPDITLLLDFVEALYLPLKDADMPHYHKLDYVDFIIGEAKRLSPMCLNNIADSVSRHVRAGVSLNIAINKAYEELFAEPSDEIGPCTTATGREDLLMRCF